MEHKKWVQKTLELDYSTLTDMTVKIGWFYDFAIHNSITNNVFVGLMTCRLYISK